MVKAKDTLTKNNEATLNALFNYMVRIHPDINKNTFIDKYKRSFIDIIHKNKNWSESTKEGYYFTIAKKLRMDNINDRYHKTYSQLGYNLKLKREDDDGRNELDANEKLYFRTNDFFRNKLENINYEEIQTQTEHNKYLLLYLLTYQPPLRTSFYISAKFMRSKDDNNKKDNYIWINRRGKTTIKYIVNKDKASNYKIYNMNKNLSFIDIIDDKLIKIINDSFIKFPRVYLFENNKKPISQTTIRNYLKDITGLQGINFNIMRASYITFFYSDNFDYNSRKKLSLYMRHSVDTASKNYNKVLKPEIRKITDVEQLQDKIIMLNYKIEELEMKLSSFENNEPNEAKINKKRYDIIYKANKNKFIIKEENLKKYNIVLSSDGEYK